MFRKTVIALLALASFGLLSPDVASARGGFGGGGGGGFHGGGMGGFHGGGMGGFHGGGFGVFHHHGFGPGFGVGLGLGLYAPYYYGDYYPVYGYEEGDEGQCYLVRRRVHTHHGWRLRTVQICQGSLPKRVSFAIALWFVVLSPSSERSAQLSPARGIS